MVRSASSLALYALGVAILIAAVWVLYTQTGLVDVIPIGVVAALILAIIGVAALAAADRLPGRTVVRESAYPPTPVRERETVYDDPYDRDRRL